MDFDTFFQHIEIRPHERLIIFNWKPTTIQMTDDEFSQELNFIAKTLLEHKDKVDYAIVITEGLKFILTPSLQKKLKDTLIPAYNKAGIKKLAMILPHEDLLAISVEDTVESGRDRYKFDTKFFSDVRKAHKWLHE